MFSCPKTAVMKTNVDTFGNKQYEDVVKSVLDQYEELK